MIYDMELKMNRSSLPTFLETSFVSQVVVQKAWPNEEEHDFCPEQQIGRVSQKSLFLVITHSGKDTRPGSHK